MPDPAGRNDVAGMGASPRVALLWPARYRSRHGGSELVGDYLRRAFPRAEIITMADCSSSMLCRIGFRWLGIGDLLKAVAVGRRFFKLHKKRRFDAVIASGIMGFYLSMRHPDIPVISLFPAPMVGLLRTPAIPEWNNRLAGYATSLFEVVSGWRKDCRITVSEKSRADIERHYRLDYGVIPLGIDTELFVPGEKYLERRILGLPVDAMLALYVGRPEFARGIDILRGAAEHFPQVKFVLVTSKEFTSDRENLIVRSDVVDQEALARYYRAADFLFHPTRAESCMPYTLLEAMSADLPVITNRMILHSLPPGVDSSGLGIVVDDHRAELYFGAVQKFIDKPMRVQSRRIVQAHFSFELFAKRWRACVAETLAEYKNRASKTDAGQARWR